MLRTVLLSLILLVSLSSTSSILRKSLKRRQSDAPPCNAIEGFECKCTFSRVICTTNRDFSTPLNIIENEKHKYQSVELVISATRDIQVNDRTFETIKELYKNDGDNYEFRIKFEKFTGLHLSSPGLFNRIFPDNIPSHARKQIALEIYNPEVAPSENLHLFQNLHVDTLELYALYPFHGTFQQLFDGANIKYLRLSGGDMRSDLSHSFTGTIGRLELAKQASALSIQNFPVYPAHELIINAFYITEFNPEHPPNYSNLGELRVFSPGRIPANAFHQYPNIHTLSISTDTEIDPNALHGLNNLEKLSIKEPNPSLKLLNSVPNVKEFETNIEKLNEDEQCQLVEKLANGQVAVQAIPNGRECTCINAYLNTAVARTTCEPQGCERSSCTTIRNNYDPSIHAFKAPPTIRRSDGSDALRQREPRVYTKPYQVQSNDRDKLHRGMPQQQPVPHTPTDDDSQRPAGGSHEQAPWQGEQRPDTHPSWPTSSDVNHNVVTDDNQKSDSYDYPSGADNNNNNNNNNQDEKSNWNYPNDYNNQNYKSPLENIPENNYPSDRDSSNQYNNQDDKSQWEPTNEERNPSHQSPWEHTNEESNPTDKSHWENTNEEKNPSDQSKWDYSNQYDKDNDVELVKMTTTLEWKPYRDDTTTPVSFIDDSQAGQSQDENRDDSEIAKVNEGEDTQQEEKGHENQQDKEGHEHHPDKEGHEQHQSKEGGEKQPGGNGTPSGSSGDSNTDAEGNISGDTETSTSPPPKKGMNWLPIIIIAASIVVLLIIGLGILFLRKKNANKGYDQTATSDQAAGGNTART